MRFDFSVRARSTYNRRPELRVTRTIGGSSLNLDISVKELKVTLND